MILSEKSAAFRDRALGPVARVRATAKAAKAIVQSNS